MPKPVRETARLLEAATTSTGNRLMQLISPGWGSSGYYSSEVLEQAVADQLFPAGTHMYADHDHTSPNRSVKDLISVTTGDGRIATDDEVAAGADMGAVVAEIRIASPYRDLIDDIGDVIGVSISGDATDISIGEAGGRRGKIIEGLAHVESVDWVTHAGRGGKVLSVLESARTRLDEATVNDTREALGSELGDAYADDKTYVSVRDFDNTTVWFEIDGPNGSDLYAQAYTQSADGTVALTGDRTEVHVVTTYVPATRPDGTTTTESREDTMPKIQIEESEHTRLIDAAGRVDALLSENATLKNENTSFKATEAARTRTERARELVTERAKAAGVAFDDLQVRGLVAELPLTESGDLDETAFSASVDTAATNVKEAALKGATGGDILGFGGDPNGLTEARPRTTNPWGRNLTESKGA